MSARRSHQVVTGIVALIHALLRLGGYGIILIFLVGFLTRSFLPFEVVLIGVPVLLGGFAILAVRAGLEEAADTKDGGES